MLRVSVYFNVSFWIGAYDIIQFVPVGLFLLLTLLDFSLVPDLLVLVSS